eukprot:GHVS01038116.1.p2 GENE.GHVS01038116.1~~GHVS01038116.1.p2  ORF type:complete len:365 (-),score=80.46 GHVS01038116.1:1594-2688(-)
MGKQIPPIPPLLPFPPLRRRPAAPIPLFIARNKKQTNHTDEDDLEKFLQTIRPDLFVVCAFGQILSPSLLQLPSLTALNLHPSLLPLYRGPAPVQRALEAGEEEVGISVVEMNERIDRGRILWQQRRPLEGLEEAHELSAELFTTGAQALLNEVPLIPTSSSSLNQSYATSSCGKSGGGGGGESTTKKVQSHEGLAWLDKMTGVQLVNKIRGLTQHPTVHTYFCQRLPQKQQTTEPSSPELVMKVQLFTAKLHPPFKEGFPLPSYPVCCRPIMSFLEENAASRHPSAKVTFCSYCKSMVLFGSDDAAVAVKTVRYAKRRMSGRDFVLRHPYLRAFLSSDASSALSANASSLESNCAESDHGTLL